MRARYFAGGFSSFAEHEILEFLLFYSHRRLDTNKIAHRMLREFGSLHNVFEADFNEISKKCKVTPNTALLVTLVPQFAAAYLKSKNGTGVTAFKNAADVAEYAAPLFIGCSDERLYVLCLDAKRRLISTSLIDEGTVDEVAVYPRKVAEAAIGYKASAVILAHNHPSGSLAPTRRDLETTEAIVNGLGFMRINVLDHVIIAGDKHYSFASRGQHVVGYV